MMTRRFFSRFPLNRSLLAILLAFCLALFLTVALAAGASAFQSSEPGGKAQPVSPRQADAAVQAVWQRVRDAGAYAFNADVTQTEIPLATVNNVGRTSKTSRFYMEGQADPGAGTMNLTLWGSGGSVLDASSGISVRVNGDQVEARQGQSGEWQQVDSFGALFAPDSNFATFLVAARDVVAHPEADGLTRYTFSVDGPRFAAYMRDQLRDQMVANGELPPNMSVELPKIYVEMTGQGELWVGADGLPIRQEISLNMPEAASPQEGTRLEIFSAVTFSDFAVQAAASSAPLEKTGLSGARELASLSQAAAASATKTLPTVAATLVVLLLLLVLLRYGRTRSVYATFALGLVGMMVLAPVLQSVQAAQAENRRTTREEASKARQEESEMM
ncbi:MAG: hypothetical protein PVH18_02095, partial [Chloroflexota bacterium]